MVATAKGALLWVRQNNDGFFRSACGRFDLWEVCSGGARYWVCYDADLGLRFADANRSYVELWARRRAGLEG
jgi:hypothetical protein